MNPFDFNAIWQMVLLLSILVVVHEFGHFITARMFGVTVYEFSVGFGPLIAKIKRNGIQYSFRWFLLGGFVKIAGLDIALEGETGETVDSTTASEPEKQVCLFHNIAYWKRVLIIAAGPISNVILGMILTFCLCAFVGWPSGLKESPTVLMATPGFPAFEAGIRPGDKVAAINDVKVRKWVQIPELVQKFGAHKLKVEVVRDGRRITTYITPQYAPELNRHILGIEGVTSLERIPVKDAAKVALIQPWSYTQQIVEMFVKIARKEAKGTFMGPIGMVVIMEQISRLPLMFVIYKILELAIGINMFLFIFNMLPLPLPLLDGGWIVIMTLEKLFKREFSVDQKAAAQMVGMVGVLLLGVLIAYGDVRMLIRRFFGG
jgi:regulator of sigma E protease